VSDSSLKNKFDFILVEPSHPGNIGATARAIKNMGFTNLSLVNPKDFPNNDAFYRAKGAKDILEKVKIYEDLSYALKDATLIFGTSARTRTIPWPTKTSSELSIVLKKALESSNAKVCFVFGREISGLSNEELQMCDYHIKIPTDEDFSSINLSHAVQIISYVVKMEIENIDLLPEMENESQTFQENENLIDHFDEVMKKMDFYDQENPKQVKTRMRRLIKRLQPDKLETGILRGFLAKIEQILNKKN
jgi:tRNA (cytidine32/uridine32-2'-O)-methyltransferase